MKIGHYETKWKHIIRWVLHFPIGAIIAHMALEVDAVLACIVAVFFLAYEVMEDKVIGDWSFIDVFGSLLMLIGGGYIIYYVF